MKYYRRVNFLIYAALWGKIKIVLKNRIYFIDSSIFIYGCIYILIYKTYFSILNNNHH